MNAELNHPTVLSVLQDAKPLHCDCGYPKCSRNRLRADIDQATADLHELIATGDFMAMNATPGMLGRWARAKAAVQGGVA